MSDPEFLRPFFTFFGGKWNISPSYPSPRYNTIVEGFAGSAGYSLNNYKKDVILIEKDPDIYSVWEFLISSSREDIMSIPDLSIGQMVDSLDIPLGAKNLLGFWCGRGRATPGHQLSGWGKNPKYKRYYWGQEARNRIISQLKYISHWQILNNDFFSCCQILNSSLSPVTWFIDPPYKYLGGYKMNAVDYSCLSDTVRALNGQKIVCEGPYGDYLPFVPLVESLGNNGRVSSERVYILDN